MSFDTKGDLWIEVDLLNIPQDLLPLCAHFTTQTLGGPGIYKAVVQFNLSEYIRKMVEDLTRE